MAGFFNEGLCPPPVKRCKHRSGYKSTAKLSRSRERARCFHLARTLESQQGSESQLKTKVNLEKDMSNFDAPSLGQSYNSNPENVDTVVSRKSNGTESIKGYVRVPRRISGDKVPGD